MVTSHNYGRFLDEALDSLLDQVTGQIIVVDDASDSGDQTKEICEKRIQASRGASVPESSSPDQQSRTTPIERISYLRTEYHNVHLARAAGFALCKSPLVCFLDADNTHQPGYLDAAAKLFATNPRLAIVYPDLQHFGDRTDFVTVPEFDRDRIEQSNCIDTGSVWLREPTEQPSRIRRLVDGTSNHP